MGLLEEPRRVSENMKKYINNLLYDTDKAELIWSNESRFKRCLYKTPKGRWFAVEFYTEEDKKACALRDFFEALDETGVMNFIDQNCPELLDYYFPNIELA